MPGVDGIDLFFKLRADPDSAQLPVIFLTANHHVLERRLADYAARGALLVRKPFRVDELVEVVTRALGQEGAEPDRLERRGDKPSTNTKRINE